MKYKRLVLTKASLEALRNPPKVVPTVPKVTAEPVVFKRRGRAGQFQAKKLTKQKAKAAAAPAKK